MVIQAAEKPSEEISGDSGYLLEDFSNLVQS